MVLAARPQLVCKGCRKLVLGSWLRQCCRGNDRIGDHNYFMEAVRKFQLEADRKL